MTGKDINAKRVSAGILGALICTKVGIARSRLIDIERDYASDDELARPELGKLAKDAGLSLAEVHLRAALRPQGQCLRSLGVARQVREAYEVRWLGGRRFDSRKKVNTHQAQLLVEGGVCSEVRSPTGCLRCLKLRRTPALKRFVTKAANTAEQFRERALGETLL